MTRADSRRLQPEVPFLYEMVISFFHAARIALDPVLQEIDGYRELQTDQHGGPVGPDHVARKVAELPIGDIFGHVGACLSATTNLGLAYVHSFRLLSFLTQNKDALPPNATKPHLAKLYDALPSASREALRRAYDGVGAHDFEIELRASPSSEPTRSETSFSGRSFRSALAYWQSHGMLQDSHLSLSSASRASVIRVFVPFRSVLVLDRILADQVAPTLGLDYKTMDQQMSSRTEDPELKWDGGMIYVSLPDKLGRLINATWIPGITSVVRIRESGTEEWSPGFETPFNKCSFVGLKPDTEYDVQVTHKNEAGEGEPAVFAIKSDPRTA
ncbi:MAG: fibronectin type III domain-containing protein [Bryobacterales bacterium]|nr:fibronectin type III domain-containing protein [Bryobacterales bacterium]